MIVGIDLGTTNSLVGASFPDGPRLFPNATGSFMTPSAVSLDADGGVMVGVGAIDRLVTHADRSVASFKRWMGSARETVLGDRSLRAEQLSALVLRSLITDAEAALGETVTEAVISVPAYFSDAQRTATRLAGELAGVKVERLINEPTAAALVYGLQRRIEGGRFLVLDLGGGTLDVSIIEVFDGIFEVHASAGDNYLGGDDFLDVLIKAAAEDLDFDPAAIDLSERAQLRRRIDAVKLALSSRHDAVSTTLKINGGERAWSIDEARFAKLAEPLVQRLRQPLERALRDSNTSPQELDEVVLVGGATRMPLVARMASRLLGRLPLRHVDPDRAIALGAVVASGMKARDVGLKEVILTDVCPYTLGTNVSKRDSAGVQHENFLLPIISRNSTVPVSREQELWPMTEDQKKLTFIIYQGEHPIADKNVRLGQISVDVPRGVPFGDRSAIIRFTYDINGILQVEVTVKKSNERKELVLTQAAGALTPDEIRQRLADLTALKVHPREKQENLALVARAERLYEEYINARDLLQGLLFEFRQILDTQDDRQIARARQQFVSTLEDVERA